jgi:hypothetical protein
MLSLTLPNGLRVKDAAIVPNALQTWSSGQMDPNGIFERLSTTAHQPVTKDIKISKSGLEPILVPGAHPALHYRGNALKRHKIWAQTRYERGLLKYGYTGWQHAVSAATRDVAAYPDLNEMLHWLNDHFESWLSDLGLPPQNKKFNHVIFTRYEDHNDFIGMHADKEKNFAPDTYFVVFKLGCPRDFAFSYKDEVFWQQPLPTGTAIIVKTGTANRILKHGVPPSPEPVGPSGSIVFRCIRTVIPWPVVEKNIERAKRQRKMRKALKARSRKRR